ncbi:MAG: hypothetical protein ACLP5H_20050 [Desulfomonilaceae bacterium]
MSPLEEKLKRLAEKAAEEKVDWEACKSEWIARVGKLYDEVEEWLMPWKEKGYITLARTLTPKSEEPLGDYEIGTLEITAGDETIVFEPFRRLVIGALGRIDVYLRGFKSDAQMLLSLEDAEGRLRWELWRSKYSGPGLPFNKETLEKLLEEWL